MIPEEDWGVTLEQRLSKLERQMQQVIYELLKLIKDDGKIDV